MERNLLAITLCVLGFAIALCINMLAQSFHIRVFSAWLLFQSGYAASWQTKNLAKAACNKQVD